MLLHPANAATEASVARRCVMGFCVFMHRILPASHPDHIRHLEDALRIATKHTCRIDAKAQVVEKCPLMGEF
jgi:hypothetical protein